MSGRITITDGNDDVDVISRSVSRRRQRSSHYWSQRASTAAADTIPLLPNITRASLPSRPPPIYQPQPHQLIAVCFNHMAGRECAHCLQLNDQHAGHEREEESPDSGRTLGHEQQQQSHHSGSDLGEDEKPRDGGEQGGHEGPPAPVGMWDKRLSKLRLQVLVLWARTSQLPGSHCIHTYLLTTPQP